MRHRVGEIWKFEAGTTTVTSSAYLMNVLPVDTQCRSYELIMNSEGSSSEPWATLELIPREEEARKK